MLELDAENAFDVVGTGPGTRFNEYLNTLTAPAVPEHIVYDASGARIDTSYSVVNAGNAGINANSYTINTIQQGENAPGVITYRRTGGFAYDNLGSHTHTGSGNAAYSWPADTTTLQGDTNNGARTYTIPNASGNTFDRFGSINNGQTGLNVRNIGCNITIDDVVGADSVTPTFWVRRGNADLRFLSQTINQGDSHTFVINGTFSWGRNDPLRMGMFLNSTSFTYTVNFFRVNLEAEEEFAPIGTGGTGGGGAGAAINTVQTPVSYTHLTLPTTPYV